MSFLPSRRRVFGALVALSSVGITGGATADAAPFPAAIGAPAQAVSPGATFVPLNPARIADTRRPFGSSIAGKIPAGATTTIQVTGRAEAAVPSNATAVVLNVTADGAGAAGYATVYPAGIDRPNASNLNYSLAGYTGANLVTVKLGAGGAVHVFTDASAHVIVDIFGYYVPAAGAVAAGRVESAGPDRLYDTRPIAAPLAPGEYRTITLPRVPAGATAVILNYTATGTLKPGYFSILPPSDQPPAGQEPRTSNVNVIHAGATVANQVILPLGASQQVTLFTTAGGHAILDIFGYVTGATAPATTRGLFVPLAAPFRMLDTRSSDNNPLGPTLRMWHRWIAEVNVLGRGGVPTAGVGSVVGNTTFVDSHGPGYVATYPAGTLFPNTSTVNSYYGSQTVPNHTTSPISSRGVAVEMRDTGGHVLLDVSGYYIGNPAAANIPPTTNVPPKPVFPLKISIPSMNHTSMIQETTSDADLNRGPGWWDASAYPGVGGNFVVFGHRTEATAPFRNIHEVKVGDLITVEGDHRKVMYRIDAQSNGRPWVVVPANQANDWVGPNGNQNQITLIACSKPNGQATSTAYRLIVTATLISYINY